MTHVMDFVLGRIGGVFVKRTINETVFSTESYYNMPIC